MVKSSFDKQNFDWKEQLHTLCTDEAPAMLGNVCGSDATVQWEVSRVVVARSFLQTCIGNKGSSSNPEKKFCQQP
jgi:hypothetical protein